MELFYLLCSIVSTSLTSLILSLILPFHVLLWRRRSSGVASSVSNDEAESVTLYEGTVWHQRRHPVLHSFQYRVRYALIDLDRVPHAPHDHLSPDEARQITDTNGPILLLTIPPSVGYEQNPLSVYYCYAVEGSTTRLKKCIAEVTNTPWGERVSFVFNPHSDLVAKALHVSPFMNMESKYSIIHYVNGMNLEQSDGNKDFVIGTINEFSLYILECLLDIMDMLGSWNIKANDPGENLTISISVHHPEHGNYFTATLKAKKLCSSSGTDHAIFFWLMPHKVAVWIYWHALKLWWRSVTFVQHPKYNTPTYKEEALMRDKKLQCCGLSDDNRLVQQTGSDQGCLAEASSINRWFRWRVAKWPWS